MKLRLVSYAWTKTGGCPRAYRFVLSLHAPKDMVAKRAAGYPSVFSAQVPVCSLLEGLHDAGARQLSVKERVRSLP